MARWLDLTRRQLPAMAAGHHWPIRLDHCFMRVCLDQAMGQPWHQVIDRPAVRHASLEMLRQAIAVAEGIVSEPGTLAGLNEGSLRMRGKTGGRR